MIVETLLVCGTLTILGGMWTAVSVLDMGQGQSKLRKKSFQERRRVLERTRKEAKASITSYSGYNSDNENRTLIADTDSKLLALAREEAQVLKGDDEDQTK